jgi:hypothetical protein
MDMPLICAHFFFVASKSSSSVGSAEAWDARGLGEPGDALLGDLGDPGVALVGDLGRTWTCFGIGCC